MAREGRDIVCWGLRYVVSLKPEISLGRTLARHLVSVGLDAAHMFFLVMYSLRHALIRNCSIFNRGKRLSMCLAEIFHMLSFKQINRDI